MTNELMSEKSNEDLSQVKRTSRRRMRKEEKKNKERSKTTTNNKRDSFITTSCNRNESNYFLLQLYLFVAIAGLMIGYGVIGDGNPMDALNWSTWQHMLDIINGKE